MAGTSSGGELGAGLRRRRGQYCAVLPALPGLGEPWTGGRVQRCSGRSLIDRGMGIGSAQHQGCTPRTRKHRPGEPARAWAPARARPAGTWRKESGLLASSVVTYILGNGPISMIGAGALWEQGQPPTNPNNPKTPGGVHYDYGPEARSCSMSLVIVSSNERRIAAKSGCFRPSERKPNILHCTTALPGGRAPGPAE